MYYISSGDINYCKIKGQFRYLTHWAQFPGWLGWNSGWHLNLDYWSCSVSHRICGYYGGGLAIHWEVRGHRKMWIDLIWMHQFGEFWEPKYDISITDQFLTNCWYWYKLTQCVILNGVEEFLKSIQEKMKTKTIFCITSCPPWSSTPVWESAVAVSPLKSI